MRCFAVEGSMEPVEVVKPFPFVEFDVQIDAALVTEKPIDTDPGSILDHRNDQII